MPVTSVVTPEGDVISPPKLDEEQAELLSRWIPVIVPGSLLESAGYQRNLLRVAEAYGPHLIGMLVAAGKIEEGQCPIEALRSVLRGE